MTVTSLVADMAQRNPLLLRVLLPFLLVFMTIRYYRSPWRKLPPGPRGLPLIGNLHQMNEGKPWIRFSSWAKSHGPIFHLNAGGQPIIVLGSLKVAADLLDRRASIYSDRPRYIVASDLMTGGMFMTFTGFNDLWKRMRKASHEELKKSVVAKYQPIQSLEAIILSQNLLANGKEWNSHFERAAASLIMSLVYGMPIHSSGDATMAKIDEYIIRWATAALPGRYLVEFFTWMQYIPARFASWKRDALQIFQASSTLLQKLFDNALERNANGDDPPTMATMLIQNLTRNQLSHLECSWLAATVYVAGAETTAGILSWWLLAMLVYPETQKRAQEEIDRIVGRDRLPIFGDLQNMPYLQAMVKETVRWGPVAPVGVPHRLMEDDWYNGYFLPKNSIVIANAWGINRDPAVFGEDASHFNPARHLDGKGKIAPAPADTKEEGHAGFGFGRRICIGRHVVNNTLFIFIATVLWAMNIERAKDERGNLVELDVDKVEDRGLANRPMPFDCKFTPRSPDVLSVLEGTKES